MKIALAFTMADGQIFGSNASEQKTYQPVKKLFLPTPPAFGAPFGVIPSEFRRDFFLRRTTRVAGLSCDVVFEILRLAV